MRALAAAMALFLVTSSALAANPKVENALKVLQDISRDPAKMKTFCEMMVIDKKMGDTEDPVLETQVEEVDRHDPTGMSRPHDPVRGGAPTLDPGSVCRLL